MVPGLPKRPLKAPCDALTPKQIEELSYPIVGSPKYDGILGLASGVNGVYSAALKLLGNKYIQKCLSHGDYSGLQGELVVGDPTAMDEDGNSTVFNTSTGAVRRADGKPDFKFYVFDDFEHRDLLYDERWLAVKDSIILPHVVVVEQKILTCAYDVFEYADELVTLGYEGMMPRKIKGRYKEDRATLKEGIIWKIKPKEDDEAQIIGFVEQFENQNEQVLNNLGTHSRSSHKENKVPKGTLGAFIMKSKRWKEPFKCGTAKGMKAEQKQYIWDHRDEYLNQWGVYTFQAYGSIDKPRQPIFKGIRMKEDMTDY